MPARKKTLAEFVRDGTFLARRHRHLLESSPLLSDPVLRALQQQYIVEKDSLRQLKIARDLERLVRARAATVGGDLDGILASLGPTGSAQQLLNFFPRFLSHRAGPMAGRPFQLEPFQQEFLREFWARDEHGERIYTVGLLGIPKGNGKTPLAAGLGLHALLSERDAPEVYGIAGSREQARIAQRFANTFIEESELAQWLTPGATIRCSLNGGFYSLLSSDGRLGQGVMPSAALVDEFWLLEHERERESYNALARALHKRPGRAWLLAITTAGYSQTSLLAETYQRALQHPQLEERNDGFLLVLRDEESGFLMFWYRAPEDVDIEDPETIRRANPASWLRPQDLLRELRRPDTEELDWRRLHLNQWTKTRNAWLPGGLWPSLASREEIPDGAEIFVGVDVGWTHDSTAVAWAARLPDGRICLRARFGQPTSAPSASTCRVVGCS
jgi:phage terminase large subunit-like protein